MKSRSASAVAASNLDPGDGGMPPIAPATSGRAMEEERERFRGESESLFPGVIGRVCMRVLSVLILFNHDWSFY